MFGGGGGVIVAAEIKELQDYGVARIYTPEDGQKMGLQGMINDMLARCDFNPVEHAPAELKPGDFRAPCQGHLRTGTWVLQFRVEETIF